jgi:ribose transport system permease protein
VIGERGGSVAAAVAPDEVAPVPAGRAPNRVLEVAREYVIVWCVLVLGITLSISSDVFLTSTNLLNVLEQVAPVGIIACALTFVLISGEFDLSAGAIYALTGVIAAKLAPDLGSWPALGVGVLAATGLGLMNGLLVAYARINSFVCTLATSLMIAGLGLVITKGFLLAVPDAAFATLGTEELLGVKYSVYLFAAVALVCGFVLWRTKFGRWLFAVGGNSEAARLSGIDVRAVKAAAFVAAGFAAGIAGALVASRTAQGQADDGLEIVLFAFAAVVVGGTSVLGGRGAIWRTVCGVLLLALITNGFNLLGVEPIYQQIVQGAIILLAVAADSLSRRQVI